MNRGQLTPAGKLKDIGYCENQATVVLAATAPNAQPRRGSRERTASSKATSARASETPHRAADSEADDKGGDDDNDDDDAPFSPSAREPPPRPRTTAAVNNSPSSRTRAAEQAHIVGSQAWVKAWPARFDQVTLSSCVLCCLIITHGLGCAETSYSC
jgi:hypothetical protein